LRFEPLRQPCPIEQMRQGAVITENDERQCLVPGYVQPRQIADANGCHPSRSNDAIDGFPAEARHAQQILAAGAVYIERKAGAGSERPRAVWIYMGPETVYE